MSELSEETKILVKETVKNTMNRIVSEATASKKVTEAEEADDDKDAENGEGKKKEAEKKKEDDDDEEEDEEDDGSSDKLEESLTVHANPAGGKNTKGKKAEVIELKDMRELTKLAKTGKYDYFTVTKKNGQEEEYMVEKGKLVLM